MTKTPVQMAVEALECYIEHNEPNDCPCAVMWPHRDAILDALKASLLPQPPSPGSVAEAVDGGELKAGIKYAEQQRDLYRENSRHWKEWQTLIQAAAERDALKDENAALKSRLKWALQYGNFDAAKDNSTHAQILDEALKSLQQTGEKNG